MNIITYLSHYEVAWQFLEPYCNNESCGKNELVDPDSPKVMRI